MKSPLISLLAALACASAICVAEDVPAQAEASTHEEKEAYMRREYHNPLNQLVVFIHDKPSADAAAPHIAALLASPEGKGLRLPDYTLITCYSNDFYGSALLKEALLPALPKEAEALARLNEQLDEAIYHLDAVTTALEKVNDADSEAFAITALKLHLTAAGKALVRASNTAATNNLGPSAFKAHGLPMLALDRLFRAFGHARARMPEGSPELVRTLVAELREHLEHTAFYDPQEVTPESIRRHEAQAAALHEWFSIASTIHDKASADAAAEWLAQKNNELGVRLNSCPHHKLMAESPLLSLLEEAEANIYLYLSHATPAYFGSESLKHLYSPETPEEPAP